MLNKQPEKPNLAPIELDVFQEYYLEVARKELAKATECFKPGQIRRARGQEFLREALLFYTKLPSRYTNEDFSQEYDRVYNLAYRGY